jgi:hypothetical protein
VRISLDGRKADATWCSFEEKCESVGTGENAQKVYKTPFTTKEMRGLLVTSDFVQVAPDGRFREFDADGKETKNEADGYSLKTGEPDDPVFITFDRPRRSGARVGASVLNRKPTVMENGQPTAGMAFKVYPLTDAHSKFIDSLVPPEMRQRKRDRSIPLETLAPMHSGAFLRLVDDVYGFEDDNGQAIVCTEKNKENVLKAIMSTMSGIVLGMWATNRADAIQRERMSGLKADVSD